MAAPAIARAPVEDAASARPRAGGRERHGARNPRRHAAVAPRRDGHRLDAPLGLRDAHAALQRQVLAQQEGPRRHLGARDRRQLRHAARHSAVPPRQRDLVDDPRLERRRSLHRALETHESRPDRARRRDGPHRRRARREQLRRVVDFRVRPHRDDASVVRRRAAHDRLLALLARHGHAQGMVQLGRHDGRLVHLRLRLRLADAPALHQLPPQVGLPPPVARHDLQGPQHLHRRPLRLHHQAAHHAPPRVLPRRHHLPRDLVPAFHLRRRHVAHQRVRAGLRRGRRREGPAAERG
mmetsp:Transcript_15990/g.64511  ORF Transcript_15990/g.64511 Transcript_15990/m.64511 type:complete len:295 (+) Transcript_15990:708-1592(+)